MSPFNKMHTTFYLPVMETTHLSCTIFKIQQVICRKLPILTYLPAFAIPVGVTHSNFAKIFGSIKLESLDFITVTCS